MRGGSGAEVQGACRYSLKLKIGRRVASVCSVFTAIPSVIAV